MSAFKELNRKTAAVVAALIAATLVAAGCGSNSNDSTGGDSASGIPDGPIVIGAATAETGVIKDFDGPALAGAKVAINDINADGGIDGHEVKFVHADMKSKPTLGPQAAIDVIDQGAKVVIVSCDFDFGSPAASVAQDDGDIAMSLCAGSTKFGPQGIGPLAYTAGTPAAVEGAALAEWGYKEKGWRTAYSLTGQTLVYSEAYRAGFDTRWKELTDGKGLLGADQFQEEDQSIAAQITRIKNLPEEPDVISFCSFPPGGSSAIRQIRSAGITTPIVSCLGMHTRDWMSGVPGLKDFYFTSYGSYTGDDGDPEVNRLNDEVTKEMGAEQNGSMFVAGYSSMQLIAKAIEEANSTDGEAMAAAMDKFDSVETLAGATTFTPKKHISFDRPMAISEIRDGTPHFVTRYTPDSVPR